jgi:hypothetical protein
MSRSVDKGNNKITELRTILQRESPFKAGTRQQKTAKLKFKRFKVIVDNPRLIALRFSTLIIRGSMTKNNKGFLCKLK